MAAGVPVVLPAQGAFPEIAAAAGCGLLIEDTSPSALAHAWAGLLADPERLRRESERGKEAALNTFSQRVAAEAMERFLTPLSEPL